MYDARTNPQHDVEAEMKFKKALKQINPQMGLALMERDDSSINNCVETKFGESQIKSFCSYQLTHTEANFVATVDISSMPREGVSVDNELTYPRLPLDSRSDFVSPNNLDVAEKVLASSLVVDEAMINNIEEATGDQSSSEQWKKERKFRFTASKFDLISKRQRSHEKFAADPINPKPFNSRYVEHGIKNEPIAIEQYMKKLCFPKDPSKGSQAWFCCLFGHAISRSLTRWQSC